MGEAAPQQLGRSKRAVSRVGTGGNNVGMRIGLKAGRPAVDALRPCPSEKDVPLLDMGIGVLAEQLADRPAIPGATSAEHVKADVAGGQGAPPADDIASLDKTVPRKRFKGVATMRMGVPTLAAVMVAALGACGSSTQTQRGGNGEAGKPGPQAVQDAKAAFLAAQAVHVRGHTTTDSADGPTDLTIDIRVQNRWRHPAGPQSKANVDAGVINDRSYVKFAAARRAASLARNRRQMAVKPRRPRRRPGNTPRLANELVSEKDFGPVSD